MADRDAETPRSYDWTGWSDPVPFGMLDLKQVHAGPGAYVLSLGRPVHRFIGVDKLGFLDFGESSMLQTRLRDIRRCACNYGKVGHSAGWRYAFLRLDRYQPFDNVLVRILECETKAAAKLAESEVMLDYLSRHHELPPLNYSFNWEACRSRGGMHLFDDLIGYTPPS